MKAKLTAGSEIDFITQDELRVLLAEFFSGWDRDPQTARPSGGIHLNSSGNSVVGTSQAAYPIYEVPVGYTFRLHRAVFSPDGYTFGAPYTSASGYLEIRRNNITQDGLAFTQGLPAVWSAGVADAIEFRNGERVEIYVSGGPASTSLNVRLQGTLDPVVTQ